jgi:hypothetical protein
MRMERRHQVGSGRSRSLPHNSGVTLSNAFRARETSLVAWDGGWVRQAIVVVISYDAMPTEVTCGRCRRQYDSDVQMPVCPHALIADVERERKANTEGPEGNAPVSAASGYRSRL